MKLLDGRLWLGFASLLLVLSLFMLDFERTSPGPISATHAQLKRLDDEQGCKLCHGTFRQSLADACNECHLEIRDQLARRTGFHGNLSDDLPTRCERCHVEHHGRQAKLVSARSFVVAGVQGVGLYDHAGLDFELAGAHDALDCETCHTNANADVLAVGGKRYLGLEQECATCHEDPHAGRMGASCAACHGQEQPFAEVASFAHPDEFPLAGAHATPGCADCHAQGGSHSVERLAKWQRRPVPRTCADCHESPHSAEFAAGVADFAGVAPDASCSVCHAPVHGGFEGEGVTMSVEVHDVSGFSLAPPHHRASCADCHTIEGAHNVDFVAHRPARGAQACEACHEDAHGGQFQNGAFAGEGCRSCHDSHTFDPPAFDAEQHELTAFALRGTHRKIECAACHLAPAPESPRIFTGTSASCEDCHADVHRGVFDRPGLPEAVEERTGCARCHDTEAFHGAPRTSFDHGRWTSFALQGAHARADCVSCHGPAGGESDGRSFGFADQRFEGSFAHCATCHDDPHMGAFDDPRASPEASNDCTRCHSTESFHEFSAEEFDHGHWTGFELSGVHAETACAACHVPDLAQASEQQKFLGPAAGRLCSDCHADPHAGQFARAGTTECAACHAAGGATFAELVFDHQRDSSFPLDDRHSKLACAACHVSWPIGNARETVRYKPLGTACSDCHGHGGKQ